MNCWPRHDWQLFGRGFRGVASCGISADAGLRGAAGFGAAADAGRAGRDAAGFVPCRRAFSFLMR